MEQINKFDLLSNNREIQTLILITTDSCACEYHVNFNASVPPKILLK